MAVPSTITDLSVTATSNSPAGTDVPNINTGPDDYLRALASIIRREQAQFTAVASAATVDLGAIATGNYGHITGTVTITSFGTVAAGIERTVVFDGILTLTHNATSLILRTGANRTTAAGDVAVFVSEGSGNWREKAYHKVETAYQPLDDQLTTLAGITAQQATDLAAVSTFMGTVLNDADAATARATLGLPALLNQNYGSDGVTKITTNTTGGVDFNTHTSAGVYNFDTASSANAPVTGLGLVFLEVFRHYNLAAGSEYTIQIAHDMNSGSRARSWTRRQVAGTWSDWVATTSGPQSYAADGYKMLPGGLIVQWGAQTVAASTTSTYSFPLAFPNTCMQFVAGTSIDGPVSANRNDSTGGVHISTSQYQLRQGSASGGITIRWIAVGY